MLKTKKGLKNMKRALFLVLISFCAQLIFSAENVWCGGISGEWNKAENWSLGKCQMLKMMSPSSMLHAIPQLLLRKILCSAELKLPAILSF